MFWRLVLLAVAASCYVLQVKVIYENDQQDLYLRGNNLGLSWDRGQKLNYIGSFTYTTSLSFSASQMNQTIEMKALIDDEKWMVGANAFFSLQVTSSQVYTATIYPWFGNYNGSLEYINDLYSPQLDNTRDIIIFLPASFYENSAKPINHILIMHDGQNVFDPDTAFMHNAWMAQDTINVLVPSGKMEEVLIIGVYNTPDRMEELTYSKDAKYGGGKADLYLDFIEQTVLPAVQKKYNSRLVLEQATLGILGSSLGGLCSCYAGWTRSSVYSRIGCMSSSFWWNNGDFNRTIIPSKNPAPSNLYIYVDSGNAGPEQDDMADTIIVKNHLQQITPYQSSERLQYFLDKGGEHNEAYWRRRFWRPMSFFYPVRTYSIIPQ